MKKPKFSAGQVVMVIKGAADYPVKLDHITHIGRDDVVAWMDTLHNVEYEDEMRPLTAREIGPGKGPKNG